ncbi:hypothetical protein NW754_012481 [Fusarium falciforme]|uniref:Uncharacterized protein n=1 Tax=Fusarium falciforme TaxID=195108 RepID=A0A9W8REX8_9HYPO|nr:hypothetical protein NW754_012481 [Fusarium falciforme]KAJ4196478.1 hypothetical protein NW755_001264 [Fusarium falciforme]KAJ4203629.1 hypothetical protein NW767_005119 [Fusarium falciforme]KAJ4252160.1 hypothetical protein NW757_006282 [Fusarium falciforme]
MQLGRLGEAKPCRLTWRYLSHVVFLLLMPLSAWVTPHYAAASRKTRVLLDSMWPFEFIRLNQRTNVSALDTGSEHWRHITKSRPRGKGVSAGGELDTITQALPAQS